MLAESFSQYAGTTLSVVALGILNALRPSVFLMIIFLLSAIVLVDERKVLKVGLSFTAGAFVGFALLGYFFMGLVTKFSVLRYLAAFLGISVGAYKILSAKGVVSFQLMNPLREKTNTVIEKATSPPVAFLSGSIMALISLSCGCALPIYLVMSSIVSGAGFSIMTKMVFLLTFVGISVLPLLLVTLGFHYAGKYEKAGEAVNRLSKIIGNMDLAVGVVLVAVSLFYIIFLA
ncbi:cytochrome C biogenesis protein [Thermococcus sp. 101 C5]|uniref:cytochrome C biogenesis protein n=2 Tax=Thermococcus TaxID=2263 RepID=UPI00352EEC3B